MRNLLRFFAKNHVVLLFLFLEAVSMILIFNYNNYQKVRFLNSSNRITASVYNVFNNVADYFSLAKTNAELASENSELRNLLGKYKQIENLSTSATDTSLGISPDFSFNSAKVINNSVYKQYNYLTLNKGKKDGIKTDQGIISSNGVIGIVLNVSDAYSTGISLLNKRLNVSAKIKKYNYFGSLDWDGKNYRYIQLLDIPFHIELNKGDTIVTSGRSLYFPEDILIGTIDSFYKKDGENFYTINVKLSADFQTISYVSIIENLNKEAIINLEQQTNDGQRLD